MSRELLVEIVKKAGLFHGDNPTDTDEELKEAILEEITTRQEQVEKNEGPAFDDLKAVSAYYRRRMAQIFKIAVKTNRKPELQIAQICQLAEETLKDRERSARFYYPLEDDPEDAEAFNIVDLEKS
jgi:hypothetical protein